MLAFEKIITSIDGLLYNSFTYLLSNDGLLLHLSTYLLMVYCYHQTVCLSFIDGCYH